MHAQIAPEAFDRVILEITVAAEQLERVVDDIRTAIGCESFGHGGKAALVRGIGGNLAGREIEQRARRLQLGRHVRQHELGVLEICNRLAELLTFLGVFDCLIETALRPAQ